MPRKATSSATRVVVYIRAYKCLGCQKWHVNTDNVFFCKKCDKIRKVRITKKLNSIVEDMRKSGDNSG